jgi:type IV pilus assembly protein PilM
MKPAPGVWGIDLGQCALKALRVQEVDGQLTATAFDYVEYPKLLNQPDADAEQLTREALEQFLSRNTLRGDTVAIAVPGQSGLARFVKLPPVEEKKIADIVKFEAKQQIPFNLEEVVWDYQKIGSGEVIEGLALETEIGLFAMKRDLVKRYIDNFKDVGVEVHIIQMAPLALCNFVAYDLLHRDPGSPAPEGKLPCVVALDLGTDSSNLVITDGNRVIWQRPIALGGNHFTRALTKEMKLTFAKAEHLKRNATKSGQAELKKILATLKPVLNDFVGEVQRSLGYFTNTHRDAQIEYMIGLGNAFRLPGMQRFLAEKLQLDVRKLEKMERLVGDAVLGSPIYQENLLSFGVAYGLCLQGIQRARLITNLLPSEIRLERLVRAKKPWAAAAASLLLIGLGGMALGSYLDERPYSHPSVRAAIEKASNMSKEVKNWDSKFAAAKKAAQDEEEAVKSIVAGQAERINWMHLLRFLSDVVPQPDGKNLPPETIGPYFEQRPAVTKKGAIVMSGKEAYAEYQRRIREGFKPVATTEDGKEVDPMPPGIDDLVQFHIESIDCRFCDDLASFWKAARKGREDSDIRPVESVKKIPEGRAWVIEVAGFTYHRDKESFIRNTLLTNIARLGIKANKPADAASEAGAAGAGQPAAAGAASAGAGAAPAGGVDLESTKEPVINRVSHALLYTAISTSATDSTSFEIIQSSALDSLLGSGSGASGGPGGSMMMSPMMPGGAPGDAAGAGAGGGGTTKDRSAWVSLSSRGSGGAGGMAMPGASPGMPGGRSGRGSGPLMPGMSVAGGRGSGRFDDEGARGGRVARGGRAARGPRGGPGSAMMMPGSGRGGPGMMPPDGRSGGANQPSTRATNSFGHTRTEFIILFIWQEPTPSDQLRGPEEEAPAASAAGSMMPGGMMMPPGGR